MAKQDTPKSKSIVMVTVKLKRNGYTETMTLEQWNRIKAGKHRRFEKLYEITEHRQKVVEPPKEAQELSDKLSDEK